MATSSSKPILVFDLDGTLVEVGVRDYAVYRDILEQHNLPPLPFEEYWPLRRSRTNLSALLGRSIADAAAFLPEFVRRRSSLYELDSYLERDRVLPGVEETLTRIRGRFEAVLITARADSRATDRQLDALNLRPYLHAVHVANNNKSEIVRSLSGVALVIGDTEHDIRLASEFGYPSFAVTTGIRSREFLAAATPTYLADRLTELLDVL